MATRRDCLIRAKNRSTPLRSRYRRRSYPTAAVRFLRGGKRGPAPARRVAARPASASCPLSAGTAGVRTDREYRGRVRRLPQADSKQVPPPLTQRMGGPLAVKQSGEEGKETSPVAQTYLVEVEVLDPDASLRPGALVRVKVLCKWRSAAWWVKRKLAEALDLGLYQ